MARVAAAVHSLEGGRAVVDAVDRHRQRDVAKAGVAVAAQAVGDGGDGGVARAVDVVLGGQAHHDVLEARVASQAAALVGVQVGEVPALGVAGNRLVGEAEGVLVARGLVGLGVGRDLLAVGELLGVLGVVVERGAAVLAVADAVADASVLRGLVGDHRNGCHGRQAQRKRRAEARRDQLRPHLHGSSPFLLPSRFAALAT